MSEPGPSPDDGRFDPFKVWAKYEDIAMHFNELISRLRFQALAGVAGLSASILVLADKLSGEGTALSVVAVAFLALALLWVALWILDFRYYNRLLGGAVEALVALEDETQGGKKVEGLRFSTIVLAVLEGKAPPADKAPPEGRALLYYSHRGSRRGPLLFYLIVLAVLLLLSIGSGMFAWKAGEFAHIVAPADSGSSQPAPQGSQPRREAPVAPPGALPPPTEAGDAAGAAREWKDLASRRGVEWERLVDVGARVLEPFFQRVSSAAATPLSLARTFLESFAKSAGDESAKRLVDAAADFLLGLGKAAPPAAGQPRPPSEPPLAVLTSIVRFEFGEHEIPPSGQRAIQTLIARVGQRNALWLVQGFTDRTGSEKYNDGLAARRTRTVASYMQVNDVNGSRILQRPRVELAAPEAGHDGSRDPENRRAEIVVLVIK